MRVYLVRHAIAYNRDPEAWPSDRDRPLTDAGVKKFRRAARGLQQFVPEVDTVLSSRLTRAWQTAGILMEEASWPAAVACAALEPGHPAPEAVAAPPAHATAAGVALVGHE